MLLTVDEAKNRICPMALSSDEDIYPLCVADRCMAWKEDPAWQDDKEVKRGYCGMVKN